MLNKQALCPKKGVVRAGVRASCADYLKVPPMLISFIERRAWKLKNRHTATKPTGPRQKLCVREDGQVCKAPETPGAYPPINRTECKTCTSSTASRWNAGYLP